MHDKHDQWCQLLRTLSPSPWQIAHSPAYSPRFLHTLQWVSSPATKSVSSSPLEYAACVVVSATALPSRRLHLIQDLSENTSSISSVLQTQTFTHFSSFSACDGWTVLQTARSGQAQNFTPWFLKDFFLSQSNTSNAWYSAACSTSVLAFFLQHIKTKNCS